MTKFFTLEYKTTDSKGREKTPKFAGVFRNLDDLESAKNKLLQDVSNRLSFHVYTHEQIFTK
jgi:hypothetical protein